MNPSPNRPINLLIFVPSLRRAGAETQAIDLANGLAKAGHRTHLAAFGSELDQASRVDAQVRFHEVQRTSKYDFGVVGRVAQIIDEHEIELVLGVMQFCTLLAWLAVRRSRRKPVVVAAIHTTINRGAKEELQDRVIYRWLLARLPAVVFVCKAQRDHWVKKFQSLSHNARVIYNGVDATAFAPHAVSPTVLHELRARLQLPARGVVFSCIAGFRPEKGHDLLIQAFSRLPSHTHLLLAGDGETRRPTETLVRDRGLGDRVRFLGTVADSRPVIALSTATVLASTSVETFSMAMLESMAMGVPVIAPRLGGLHEAVLHTQTGLLYSAGNVAELAACMNAVAANEQLVTEMSANARQSATTTFTTDRMVSETATLFASLTESAPPQPIHAT